jgi:UDP-glucuronate 4-epimerase
MPGKALVTGGAGFIGSHLVDSLLADGWAVDCLDNFDPYYAATIKHRNITPHLAHPAYRLIKADLRDAAALAAQLATDYQVIVHLAAKAGVRNSLTDPLGYQMTNMIATAFASSCSRPHPASTAIARTCPGARTISVCCH